MRLGIFTAPFRIFLITLALVSVGIILVYSASGHYAAKKERRAIATKAKSVAAKEVDGKLSSYQEKKIEEEALAENHVLPLVLLCRATDSVRVAGIVLPFCLLQSGLCQIKRRRATTCTNCACITTLGLCAGDREEVERASTLDRLWLCHFPTF